MKGQKPINTVADLMAYLGACPPNASVVLMPEDGEGLLVGGVLEFAAQPPEPAQVWILIDEFSEVGPLEWAGGPTDDDLDEEGTERPGDMATALQTSNAAVEADVVEIRGRLKEA